MDKSAILLETARRLQFEKYRFYEPSGVAEEFIKAFKSGDNFILFLSAANGVGKTALASNILAHLMYGGSDNSYFKGGLFDKWPYLKRGRIITDSSLVDKNVVNELKFWFPNDDQNPRYTTNKGGKHFESIWKTDTGWSFDLMTYQQDPSEFEGVTLGWVWFDEPPPDAILKATIARLRRGGVIIITATPISGSAHLYDLFASGKVETTVQLTEDAEPVKVERKVFHITADVESVCREHGIRGHLKHEDIVRMVAEYPEDERQARVYGKFQHLIGLVFKKFDRNIHVIKPFPIRPEDFCVYHMLDPHPRNNDAGLWLAVDRNGTKYVIDELWLKPDDVKELSQRIKNKNSQYRVISLIGDPSMFIVDQHSQRSLGLMLQEEGLTYLEASKQRAASDERIKVALNYQENNGYMVRAPELYFFDTCQRTIWEMEHYRWDDWSGKVADRRDRKEKPMDKDDHMIENLGRGLFQEPQFVPFQGRGSVGEVKTDFFDPYTQGSY